MIKSAILASIFCSASLLLNQNAFAKSPKSTTEKSSTATEKRKPAASGIATLPTAGSDMIRLAQENNPEIQEILSLYKKTERFNAVVKNQDKTQKLFVDFIQAGRFEPDAPVASNLMIIKRNNGKDGGEGDPHFFLLGPIEIFQIKKMNDNSFELTGNGGNAHDGDECRFIGVNRTLKIEIVADSTTDGFKAKYVETADKKWCSK